MSKRFLNVEYSGIRTEINVTDMEDLSEVQVAVKGALSVDVGFGLIQLYDKQGHHITDLDDIPKEYFIKSKNGGLFLVVHTTPTNINKLKLKIDAIEQQLKKPFKAWTEGEKEEFGNHEQLREERKQLRKKEEQLRKKEEQLIELLILKEKENQQLQAIPSKLPSDITLPKLGDANSMYDIFDRLSSKPRPSFHRTNYSCELKQEDIVPPLSQLEREAVLNGTNYLWELVGGVLKPFVSIGPRENVVDEYVRCVVKSVAGALKLDVWLKRQPFINSKRAEHWVIAFGPNKYHGRIVGCIENKLPHTQYKEPYATNKNEFLVQIYDQMAEVSNYYGTNPVFGIGSTGREWRFFKLHRDDSCEIDDSCKSKEQDGYNPITRNMGSIQYDCDEEMEMEQKDGNILEVEKRFSGTKVYKWDDQEMLFMLGSVLKQMSLSKITQRSIVTEESIQNRVMWHLIKTDNVLPWGWANVSVSKLEWRSMINTNTGNVVVLGMLGNGADGKVVLVANKKGQVSAMKLLSTRMEEGRLVEMEQDAREEAENWTEIYSDYCEQYNWSIRSEKWMGIPAVIMPVLNQFTTKKERLDNLDRVRECLKLFWAKGYLHDDVYWRNIGYFKANGKIVIVLLDLHPGHVFKQDNDGSWIDEVIERLKD